jgi:hypothetical protein
VLYQLSYNHHANALTNDECRVMIAEIRTALSPGTQPIGRAALISAAIAFAASTSGPGPGTKIVFR